ncbi:MAG: hypothetical protein GC186_06590 [Rhodobacteraceae bacterium]|nr:hypothetical protein [Paracoccaceae bacterium]
MTSLDFTRGARGYLRAADMLAVAPIPDEATGFEVRFREPITTAGHWCPAAGRASAEAVATLSVARPGGTDPWLFLPDPGNRPLRSLEEVPELEFTSAATMTSGGLLCRLAGGVGFWDQLIAFIRVGGQALYPERRWQVAALALSCWPLPPVLADRMLSLQIARSRGAYVTLRFALDGCEHGTVGLFAMGRGQPRG